MNCSPLAFERSTMCFANVKRKRVFSSLNLVPGSSGNRARGLFMSFVKSAAWCLAICGMAVANAPAQQTTKPASPPMSIGMAKGFFNDISPALISFVKPAFAGLMKECTGLNGQLVVGGDYLQLSKDLKDQKLQLAVFHGFEYAWARQVDPDLQPLM